MSEQRTKQLDKEFAKAIAEMDCRRGKQYADLFDEFLDLALMFFCANPNETQQALWRGLESSPQRKAAFLKAFQAYGESAEQDYHDPLGDFFMENISHGHNGQFFTPENMCKLMAEITDPARETISDPCCGSGRLPLAGLRIARYNGVEPFLYANDLSYTCARMTLLNFLVNSVRGEVTCGDTLKYDLENFTYFHIDRVLLGSKWLSTYWQYTISTIDETNERRNVWRQMLLDEGMWVEIAEPSSYSEVEECETTEEVVVSQSTELPPLKAKPKVVQIQLEFDF